MTEHRGRDGFISVEADWRRLYSEMPNPSMWHSFEANRAYLEHLCPSPEQFRCLALDDGTRVRAILPLEERIDRALGIPLRVWGLPCGEWWRISDAIGPDDDARELLLAEVLAHLRRDPHRPSLLVLGRLPESSGLWDAAGQLGPRDVFTFPDGAVYLIRTDSFEGLMGRLSSAGRKKLRVAEQHFESLPGARYVSCKEPAELAEEFDHFLDVEASGWKGEQGTAVKSNPELEAFYRAMTQSMVEDGWCEIHSLHAEGRCIASEFCVFTGGQCDAPKAGYDEAYSRIMPGKLVLNLGLKACCEDPRIKYANEMSDAEWLDLWHPESDGLRVDYIALRPVSGMALLAGLRLRFGPIRRMVRAFRARQKARVRRARA
ncbi:MAG: GNAT family N-acetyltransferase [Coriobacteriia bacterium]|nr:GNAT family N-acetyltransferase [Coriobacteriia bacterium]